MNIAIIGAGNVGGALATQWHKAGHTVIIGTRDRQSTKVQKVLDATPNMAVASIEEAVHQSDVILISTPPTAIFDLIAQMGDVTGKFIIDATNAVRQKPEPYATVYHALVDKTNAEAVKCFNSTGFENMQNPVYHGEGIDMFMAGSSLKAKEIAAQLAKDAGFGACWDFGGSDKVELLEQFALSWINLAILQGHGRNLAFKVIKR
ncbi:NADP oxidoreductase coenzyme F420-dependent [Runella slithyformis DSM 19594]|uniref:NADP oxidoreductase coenzyme F420-dependent n=2 Tax=Runella TaxID=105 RepID=A0A7U4E3S8_RUNSL|nr:NADP oxidoreductase coenzyme F420-dependent [Runella slithyformis DSM 19594]